MSPSLLLEAAHEKNPKKYCLSAWLEQDHLLKDSPETPFSSRNCFPEEEKEGWLSTEYIFL